MYKIVICMPYQPKWATPVWEAVHRGVTQQDTSKTLKLYRVDTSAFPADVLAERIEGELRNADVIVFDLSEVNPNVHIEIGFALALGKPVLFITQDRKWVTTHLQGRIVEEYDANIADSLARLSTTLLFRIKDKLDIVKAVEDRAAAELSLAVQYQVDCFSHRAAVGLERYFREADKRIDILTTNLSFLFEDHGKSAAGKGPGPHTYFDEIEEALARKGSKLKVRILTLDPESDFAAKRGKQLGYAPGVFRDELRKALLATQEIAKKYALYRFEVRTYEDFPNQITYRIDNWIFSCVVAQPTQSRNHLAFKLDRRQAGVDNSFINHFQNVWGAHL